MKSGFFSSIQSTKPVRSSPGCGACGLHRKCQSPKMEPTGEGRRGILIVAEAPGAMEDERGVQLVGEAGRLLRRELTNLDIDLDRDCWKINAANCRPPKNRKPTSREVEWCRPSVMKAVREFDPSTIILLGGSAMESLLHVAWKPGGIGSVGRWVGWRIPSQKLNAWVCPTWHPSYVIRTVREPVVNLMFREHLKAAVELSGRPWSEVPNYSSEIERIMEPNRAARILRQMVKRGGPFSFDYETNMLKPDHPDARIVCCSVCWRGSSTIAYPWVGEAVKATGELLGGFGQKIGWSIKFEERWTQRAFGHGVTNWLWDGMQASHCLDNRQGITSAKFQSFVRLGLPAYDGSIAPFLKAKGGNTKNKIDQVDMSDLLLYCGLDSLVEYKVAELQREEIGCQKTS